MCECCADLGLLPTYGIKAPFHVSAIKYIPSFLFFPHEIGYVLSGWWRNWCGSPGNSTVAHYRRKYAYINLYHSLGKFNRWQTDKIFLTFPRKQDLKFHANPFAWNVKSCFLGNIKIFQNVVNVKSCFLGNIKIFQNVACWKVYWKFYVEW